MDNAQQQLVQKLKESNNVLVTVSRNPSVDQLSALLGLSLLLNKQGKHCAAVFSGQIPSTIEFLNPEETIEKNTDSLRDFIIALDKSKADKLRYKVEDNIVRIFITPYKTSISQDDLDFSQGDFNVDVVVALGVGDQTELDEAISAHGRILHDAVVTSININSNSDLGAINWKVPNASSLCELVTELAQAIGDNLLDEQISTALLTGIVSETDRFSNDKTSSETMSVSATLMSAGANQQLIANKLEDNSPNAAAKEDAGSKNNDGTLEISHDHDNKPSSEDQANTSKSDNSIEDSLGELPIPKDSEDEGLDKPLLENADDGKNNQAPKDVAQPPAGFTDGPRMVTSPPTMGGTLTANIQQTDIEPVTDPLSMPNEEAPQLLDHESSSFSGLPSQSPLDNSFIVDSNVPAPPPPPPLVIPEPVNTTPSSIPNPVLLPPQPQSNPAPVDDKLTTHPDDWTTNSTNSPDTSDLPSPQLQIDQDGTLSQLERNVNSPHLRENQDKFSTDSAREEVNKALTSSPETQPPEPIQALNSIPFGSELHPSNTTDPTSTSINNDSAQPQIVSGDNVSSPPPPVPPPITYDFGASSGSQ
jgi:nanoRNase/pAp phosphatase (c-di-AMP/oligoRNAs hydrolase)